jgi:phage tail sheath gpL-like
MALPDDTSLAPAVATSVNNVQFKATAENLSRKILLIGTYDPTITTIVDDVPQQILSPEDAGAKFGFGFMLHRMALASAKKGGQIETWVVPQSEDVAAVQASGTITVTVTTAVAGTIALYIGGELVSVGVTDGQTDAAIATAIAAAINDDSDLPVTASAALGVVTVTAKTGGTFGNGITIETNLAPADEIPGGVTLAIVDMASGATDPDITDALNGLGTGDNQNSEFFTDCCHGYQPTTAQMDAISNYNGVGNTKTGNYLPTVGRPFAFLDVDTVAGSSGLTGMKAVSAVRKLDRTNGLTGAPDSKTHPVEIACEITGDIATIAQANPAKGYVGRPMSIETGDNGQRWTDDYASRDDAVKNGLGTTRYKNGVVNIDKITTFYHPDNVPVSSNGYRSRRNVALLQNIINNLNVFFGQEQWQGVSIVEDATVVTGTAKNDVKDRDSVVNALNTLADAFAAKSWLYSASYTKENLTVTLRTNANGFDYTFPVVLAAEGDIYNGEVQFDIALTVFTG